MNDEINGQLKHFQYTLRSHNQSVTQARNQVFLALQGQEPQTMHELVEQCKPYMDRASVYRVINLFESLGIVQRLQIGWKYKLELSDSFHYHHHHATCNRCGQTIALPDDLQLENRIDLLALQSGFYSQTHQIEIRGLCLNCSKNKPKT